MPQGHPARRLEPATGARPLVAVALLLSAGCLLRLPSESSGGFRCEKSGDCIGGYVCVNRLCEAAHAGANDGLLAGDPTRPGDPLYLGDPTPPGDLPRPTDPASPADPAVPGDPNPPGDPICVQDCNGLECGDDPVCHRSCGTCGSGACEGGVCMDCPTGDPCVTAPGSCIKNAHCAGDTCVGTTYDCTPPSPCKSSECDRENGCILKNRNDGFQIGCANCCKGECCSPGEVCTPSGCCSSNGCPSCVDNSYTVDNCGTPCGRDCFASCCFGGCCPPGQYCGKDGYGCCRPTSCSDFPGFCGGLVDSCTNTIMTCECPTGMNCDSGNGACCGAPGRPCGRAQDCCSGSCRVDNNACN